MLLFNFNRVLHGTDEETVIPIPIDEVEQARADHTEDRKKSGVLDLEPAQFKCEPLVDQKADRCEKRQKNCDEHAAHADVIEVLLHPDDSLPNLDGELQAVVI